MKKYLWIWLVIPWVFAGFIYFSDFNMNSGINHKKYLCIDTLKLYFRYGLFITYSFGLYFYFKIKNDQKCFEWEKIGIGFSIILMNFVLLISRDYVMSLIFSFSCLLGLIFLKQKGYAWMLLSLNCVFGILNILTRPFFIDFLISHYFGEEKSFQFLQSINCFIRGGLCGIGPAGNYLSIGRPISETLQKMNIPSQLPDFQNGFVFSSLGLQYGFVGVVTVIIIYLIFIFMGLKAAKQAKSNSSAFFVLFATIIFAIIVFIGMATPVGLIVPNGEGIPLMSYSKGRILFAYFTFGIIYKNLDPNNKTGNSLSVNHNRIFKFILLMFSIIPVAIIYNLLKWYFQAN